MRQAADLRVQRGVAVRCAAWQASMTKTVRSSDSHAAARATGTASWNSDRRQQGRHEACMALRGAVPCVLVVELH